MVNNRRRRNSANVRNTVKSTVHAASKVGSRFDVLHSIDDEQENVVLGDHRNRVAREVDVVEVIQREVLPQSKETRASSGKVVPCMGGAEAVPATHSVSKTPSASSSLHAALVIQEPDSSGKDMMGVSDRQRRSGRVRVAVSNGGRHLKSKEANCFDLNGQQNVVDLVSTLTSHLDVLAGQHMQQHILQSVLKNGENVNIVDVMEGSSDSDSFFEEDMEFTDRVEDAIHSAR
ncbi:hypothetical protein V6N13_125267 [Hibiscus sabdariffa]